MSSVRIICMTKADETDLERDQSRLSDLDHIFTGHQIWPALAWVTRAIGPS